MNYIQDDPGTLRLNFVYFFWDCSAAYWAGGNLAELAEQVSYKWRNFQIKVDKSLSLGPIVWPCNISFLLENKERFLFGVDIKLYVYYYSF